MENDIAAPQPLIKDKTPKSGAPPVKPPRPAPVSQYPQDSQPVFVVEDSFYRSRTPTRPVHWSIAWSDLMMTMFVLFLTLFAHQRTHQEILAHGEPNKIADETIPVQVDTTKSALVFHPISQEVSLKTAEPRQEAPAPERTEPGPDILIRNQAVEEPSPPAPPPEPAKAQPVAETAPAQPPAETAPAQPPAAAAITPPPAPPAEEVKREELITGIYDLSKVTLANEKLERFASVELVPDKTMRIILTGDLLFPSGQADLSANAKASLRKLAGVISKTPYMVNVIGHTDDQPVRNAKFPSNWELSLARAGGVARFLIDETKLPATQFSVSGYSSFRPVQANTSAENRKANRRVEIIISKELPQAEAVTPANLH